MHSVNAIALGPDGAGIAVGQGGRIADIAPGSAQLDPASDRVCAGFSSAPPCSTNLDLTKAAVAPGGSAIAAGKNLTLLWRPGGGQFRLIAPPAISATNEISGLSMPRPDRAYLTTASGLLYRGDLAGGSWSWTLESHLGADLKGLGARAADDAHGPSVGLNAIAVDASGHGYAVGDGGLILKRAGDGDSPWQRLSSKVLDDFHSVAIPTSGHGQGALIGGTYGAIDTVIGDRVELAHPADGYDHVNSEHFATQGHTARIADVALVPGFGPGQLEAWAVEQADPLNSPERTPTPQALLHYSSDPAEPLLDPERRATPLPDSPAPAPGALSFAAFGKQDCEYYLFYLPGPNRGHCDPMGGANFRNEVIARQVRRGDRGSLASARRTSVQPLHGRRQRRRGGHTHRSGRLGCPCGHPARPRLKTPKLGRPDRQPARRRGSAGLWGNWRRRPPLGACLLLRIGVL